MDHHAFIAAPRSRPLLAAPLSAGPEIETQRIERRSPRTWGARKFSLGLLSVAPVYDPLMVALRREQIRHVFAATPRSQLFALITVVIMAWELRYEVPTMSLSLWIAGVVLIALCRMVQARTVGRDLAETLPPRIVRDLTLLVVASAALWTVPAFLWSPRLAFHEQVMIGMILLGLMCFGATSLATVPSAGLAFVGVVGAGQIRMALYHDSVALTLLATVTAVIIGQSVIASAQLFARQVQSRGELEEQGQLISLLREFQSSGSDWLWELDADLHLRYLSAGMAESIGRPAAELIGTSARRLIDPDNQHSRFSHGARALLDSIDAGKAFHEIAFPTVDGKRWYCLSGRPVHDHGGMLVGWRGVASEVSDQRTGHGTGAIKVARRDPLTGLGNRLMVREMIEEARLTQMRGQGPCVLMLLDLDRFKMVNDTLGHAVGDRLLVEIARRLETACGAEAGVGRLGGDEFAIVWRGSPDTLTLLNLAERIADAVERPIVIGGSTIHVGASIGVARAPVDGETEDQLMRSADLALYRSKEHGRGCCTFYEPRMLAKAQAERLLESDVREAVRRGDLHLHYQPIVDARSFAVVGHEALLRWSHPHRGAIGPDIFVPIIEDVGLIHQIGDWVIREACQEAARWPGGERVAVNVSVAQLTGAGLESSVEEALAASGLAHDRLELEVTETIFLGDDVATLAALASLQSLGVRLVLDDFGKGYSSFGYLSRACFSKIKIDQLFVRGAASGRRECMAIVQSILALARGLGVETTAEGIETAAQAELLAHLGCTQLQGFLFGKPVPAERIERHLEKVEAVLERPLRRRA